jgi:penicillin-binding protein 2
MYYDNARYKSFTRRALLLAGGKLTLFGLLLGRMYQLQVMESDRYTMLAEENRINMRLLAPPRGRILDRFGKPMAANRDSYRVVLVAEQARDVDQTLDALAEIIPIDDAARKRVLREVHKRRSFVPVTVRENLTWREVSRIEVHAPDLAGVMIDVGQTREYPYGNNAAHLIGYVAAVSEGELTGDPLLELPDFRVGKNGIERSYDSQLRGRAGNSQVEVNAVGRVIRELTRQEGQPGDDVRLTLDLGLQNFAVERMRPERSASGVVIDIASGDILAMVSTPSFDPGAFTAGLSPEAWREMVNDPATPLTNKATSGLYAPGSTFKMVVALAALENNVVEPDHRVFCRGFIDVGNTRFHCWKKYGHGSLDMLGAIEQSCDVYFYDIARRVGIDRISEMANRFGLGQVFEFGLPHVKAGLMPTKAWKRATIGVPWQIGDTLVAGIGQGYVLASPLQLAVMTARLANMKVAVAPRLVRDVIRDGQPLPVAREAFAPLGISEASLKVVFEGMNRVTNGERGTARRARITEPGMEMAGKTGTSQVQRITKRERETGIPKNDERPWRERDHALFVAFAPVQAPRYAAAVIVEHGGGGSKVAAPIVRDILRETQIRDPRRDRGEGEIAATLDGDGKRI